MGPWAGTDRPEAARDRGRDFRPGLRLGVAGAPGGYDSVARARGRLAWDRRRARRGSTEDSRALRRRGHRRERICAELGASPADGSVGGPADHRGDRSPGTDRARGQPRVRRRRRAPARDPAPPLPGGRALELLRMGVRPCTRSVPDALVVHEPDPSSSAGLRPLVEAHIRRRARLVRAGRPRAGAARHCVARCDNGGADHFPADADRRARAVVQDLQVSDDARRRGRRGRAGLGQCRRSSRHTRRPAVAAHAPGRASAVAERSSGRHVDRRAAPGTAGVHRTARGCRSLLGQAAARQAGHDRLGASALRIRRRLRQHGRQAVVRSLVPAPPEPGHRPCRVRQDVLRRPRAGAARASDRTAGSATGRTRQAPDPGDSERRRRSRTLSHRARGERISRAGAGHRSGVDAPAGAAARATATRDTAAAAVHISRAGGGDAGLDLGRAPSGTRSAPRAADRPRARHVPQPATLPEPPRPSPLRSEARHGRPRGGPEPRRERRTGRRSRPRNRVRRQDSLQDRGWSDHRGLGHRTKLRCARLDAEGQRCRFGRNRGSPTLRPDPAAPRRAGVLELRHRRGRQRSEPQRISKVLDLRPRRRPCLAARQGLVGG